MRNRVWGFVTLMELSLLAGCGGGATPGPQTTTPSPSPTLAISSGVPPSGSVGSAYGGAGFSLTASGGTAPYQWSWKPVSGSSLPTGLDLSPSGLISGTPQVASNYDVTIIVADSSSPPAQVSADYLIAIAGTPSLTITSAAPPDGVVGVDYGTTVTQTFSCVWSPILGWHEVCTPCGTQSSCSSLPLCTGFSVKPCRKTKQVFVGFTFTAAGGVPPYTWSAAGMPPGIDVDPSSGKVLGTPTTAGSYSVMVTVTDASSSPAQASDMYVIGIN
jgi:Putative Ig domain